MKKLQDVKKLSFWSLGRAASAGKVQMPEIISGHWMNHSEEAREGILPAKNKIVFCKNNFSVVLCLNLTILHAITINVLVRITKRKT